MLNQKILQLIKKNISVFLVGSVNSGKTYFVLNGLMPFLKEKGLTTKYLGNCDRINELPDIDIVIIDEVETLLDKEYLESQHPEEKPYYTDKYLNKVKQWHEKLKQIKQPCVYIVTRNGQQDINYFLKNVKNVDWDNRRAIGLLFEKK